MRKLLNNWIPVIAWCSVIFYLSSIPNLRIGFGTLDFVLRKIAHVTEYFVLFLLNRRAFAGSFGDWTARKTGIAAMIFSVLYAASDEFHQSFVPTRGPSVVDVGIDTAGVAAGYLFYALWKNFKELENER